MCDCSFLLLQRLLEFTNVFDCYAHSLHANVGHQLPTWLSYALSRLRLRRRCHPRHRRLRHPHLHRSLPSKESVGARTTAYNDQRHKHGWTLLSKTTMSTRHPRRQGRRTGGSVASAKNSLNDFLNGVYWVCCSLNRLQCNSELMLLQSIP